VTWIPTASQVDVVAQDAPWRTLPPPGVAGPGVTVHVSPFHVSASVRDGLDGSLEEPTATQLVGLAQDTPSNVF
jgi:hypothetical protein